MDRRAAKELLHIRDWLRRADEIVERGKDRYLADELLQEAGDSLMMKLGEAANRLSRLGVDAPDGVDWALAVAHRNFIIHQYERDRPGANLAHALPRPPRMARVAPDHDRTSRGRPRVVSMTADRRATPPRALAREWRV